MTHQPVEPKPYSAGIGVGRSVVFEMEDDLVESEAEQSEDENHISDPDTDDEDEDEGEGMSHGKKNALHRFLTSSDE